MIILQYQGYPDKYMKRKVNDRYCSKEEVNDKN